MEEKNVNVLQVLKDVVNSNKSINKEEYISLNELLYSIKSLYNETKKIKSNSLYAIKKFYNSNFVKLILNKENNKFELVIAYKDYRDSYTFEFKDNDLLLEDCFEDTSILQNVGKEILDLYNSCILLKKLDELKIENDYLNIYVLKDEDGEIVTNVLDYLIINKNFSNFNETLIKCNSLNVTNFIKDNLDSFFNNVYIAKSKCLNEIIDEYEKTEKFMFEFKFVNPSFEFNESKIENKVLLKEFINQFRK